MLTLDFVLSARLNITSIKMDRVSTVTSSTIVWDTRAKLNAKTVRKITLFLKMRRAVKFREQELFMTWKTVRVWFTNLRNNALFASQVLSFQMDHVLNVMPVKDVVFVTTEILKFAFSVTTAITKPLIKESVWNPLKYILMKSQQMRVKDSWWTLLLCFWHSF